MLVLLVIAVCHHLATSRCAARLLLAGGSSQDVQLSLSLSGGLRCVEVIGGRGANCVLSGCLLSSFLTWELDTAGA